MNVPIGATILQYRIVGEIGQGGMGIVYRAEDTRLRRLVALKFLPPELSRDTEAHDRFIQEAQAASALQHNNICTIHDIERTEDGQMFIVMDLYNGETLKERLTRGSLPLEEAIDIAMQIGQGLARAHGLGIVHRDIKPANIFVTDDGTIKILDFGLAKLGTGGNLTRVGTTLGTAAYMSPEQTRGEEVDGRTDIWSLGVVFYQMLTGQLPFTAGHDLALMYAIQNSNPLPLSVAGIPEKCQQILSKALQKGPDARYQQVSEFVADLRNLKGETDAARTPVARPRPGKRRVLLFAGIVLGVAALFVAGFFLLHRPVENAESSKAESHSLYRLAVLPFTNLRSDPETDFLGFALADQIIGNLSYLKNLVVRPSSAVRMYEKKSIELAAAGRDLNVDLILTGNYLREANMIRLTLELADVHTNAIVWRGTMQERFEDAFRLEDTVASRVVDGLRIRFSPEEIHEMRADVSRNPLAYEYYLRALSYPVTLEGNTKSVSMLRQSIALDSLYAPAYNEIGYRLAQLASYAGGQQYLVTESMSALKRAIDLNPQMLDAYGGLVSMYTELGRTEEAFENTQKILAINPNNPDGHFQLGYICRYAGFLKRAAQEMEKALSLDPKNRRFRSIGITYIYLGEYQRALNGFDLDSLSSFSQSWKAHTYILAGQPERARPFLDRVLETEPGSRLGLFCQEMKLYLDKRPDLLPDVVRKSERAGVFDGESWFNLAEQLGRFGDAEGAARNLQKAIDAGFFNYPLMLRDPLFDSVRQNPEVQRIIAKAKPKYEAFKEHHPELQED